MHRAEAKARQQMKAESHKLIASEVRQTCLCNMPERRNHRYIGVRKKVLGGSQNEAVKSTQVRSGWKDARREFTRVRVNSEAKRTNWVDKQLANTFDKSGSEKRREKEEQASNQRKGEPRGSKATLRQKA
jgi:siroheme synthase (precorrin-2 oxidase/ferrochelatase)